MSFLIMFSFIVAQWARARHNFYDNDSINGFFKILLIISSLGLFTSTCVFFMDNLIFILMNVGCIFLNIYFMFEWMKKYSLTLMSDITAIQFVCLIFWQVDFISMFMSIGMVILLGVFLLFTCIIQDKYVLKYVEHAIRIFELYGIFENYHENIQYEDEKRNVKLLNTPKISYKSVVDAIQDAYFNVTRNIVNMMLECEIIHLVQKGFPRYFIVIKAKTESKAEKLRKLLKGHLKVNLNQLKFVDIDRLPFEIWDSNDHFFVKRLDGILAPHYIKDPLSRFTRFLKDEQATGFLITVLKPKKASWQVKSNIKSMASKTLSRSGYYRPEGKNINRLSGIQRYHVKGSIEKYHASQNMAKKLGDRVKTLAISVKNGKSVLYGKTFLALTDPNIFTSAINTITRGLQGLEKPYKWKMENDKYFLAKVQKFVTPVSLDLFIPPIGANFFWVPQEKVGYRNLGSWIPDSSNLANIKEWNETRKPMLSFGKIINEELAVHIPPNYLKYGTLVVGLQGTGKSTAVKGTLLEFDKLNINFLLCEGAKSEYRNLTSNIKTLNVFTPADEKTAPFKFNILQVPEGVPVSTHVFTIKELFRQQFALYPPGGHVLKQALEEIYEDLGWDLIRNEPPPIGRQKTPTLQALALKCKEILTKKNLYDEETRLTVHSALVVRIEELGEGVLGPVFNAPMSMSIRELIESKTIIELKYLATPEYRALLISVLLANIINYFEFLKDIQPQLLQNSPRNKPKFVLLIEEAHTVFKKIPEVADATEMQNIQGFTNELLHRVLAEGRGHELGIVLIDQNPTSLPDIALKLPRTLLSFKIDDLIEREAIRNAKNLNNNDLKQLASLKTGMACLKVKDIESAFYVQFPSLKELHFADLDVSKKELADLMRIRFFNQRSELLRPFKNRKILNLVNSIVFHNDFFEKLGIYAESNEDLNPLIDFLIMEAFPLKEHGIEISELVESLLKEALAKYSVFKSKGNEEMFLKKFRIQLEAY